MKLSIEEVQRYKNNKYSIECIGGTVKMSDGNVIDNLCETIEAQRQEIEQLRSKMLLDVVNNDLVKTYEGSALDKADQYIERLEKENKQLQQELNISKAAHADTMKSMSETIQQLQQEVEQRGEWIDIMTVKIEQLQAQVAKAKELLNIETLEKQTITRIVERIEEALEAIEGSGER
jgi:uncharacterized coiled-coil protein SlyX